MRKEKRGFSSRVGEVGAVLEEGEIGEGEGLGLGVGEGEGEGEERVV